MMCIALRWFTPEYEIDLCGHATLASAYIIKNFIEPHLQEINFTTQKAGSLKAHAKDGTYTLDFPARMPEACDVPDKLLPSLGISNAVEVLKSRDYFVVLPNEEAVRNVEPDYTLMKELDTIGVIVTAKGHEAMWFPVAFIRVPVFPKIRLRVQRIVILFHTGARSWVRQNCFVSKFRRAMEICIVNLKAIGF